MSLQLMRERMKQSGFSAREEMAIDARNLLKEEMEYDVSYSPTMFFFDPANESDDRPAMLRIYDRKYSSLNGNYQHFLAAHDNPIKIGDYLHDKKDDTFWLIYNSFNVDDIHYEGKMIQCNYLLRWQLPNGNIVNRWANIVSASKYGVGESGNNILTISTNTYTILIGYCEEGFYLEGQRVFIDMREKNPTNVFEITRSDDVLYNSESMGRLLSFMADKRPLDPRYDNQELRICNYRGASATLPPQQGGNETAILSAVISGDSELQIGFANTYSVMFVERTTWKAVDSSSVNFKWNVVGEFEIEQSADGDEIKLLVEDKDAEDEKIKLQVIVDGIVAGEMVISISGIM